MKRILAAFLCACLLVLPAAAVTGAPETEAGSAVLMEKRRAPSSMRTTPTTSWSPPV